MFLTKVDLNKNSFKREERLKSKKIITSLFDRKEGSFFVCKPLTVAYKIIKKDFFQVPQVGFTVPKSKFKHAVDRNLIKRRIRAAYNNNKKHFLENAKKTNITIAVMFIYNKNNIAEYIEIEKAVKKFIDKNIA